MLLRLILGDRAGIVGEAVQEDKITPSEQKHGEFNTSTSDVSNLLGQQGHFAKVLFKAH